MKTIRYVLAIASLVVGIILLILSLEIEGVSTTLGVILGLLLIANGGLRLWLLRKHEGG